MSAPVAHTAHHAPEGFIRRYVFSLDHKVIGIQYYFLGLFSVFIGMALSLLMRFHMVNPEAKVAWFAKLWPTAANGGMMTPEFYLSLMTMHGTIMVFFVLTTVPSERLRQLLPADPDRRRGHGLPGPQHAVLLDHVRRPRRHGLRLLRAGRRAARRLDRLSAAQRHRPPHRPRRRPGPDALDRLPSPSSAALP